MSLLLALAFALHPIHTTVLELRWEARSGRLEGTLRVFEDDLLAATADAGASTAAYILKHVAIIAGGRSVVLETCGKRRVADAVLVCLRGTVRDARGMRIRNTVLMERHADQVNIVRVEHPVSTTLLLTRRSPEQAAE